MPVGSAFREGHRATMAALEDQQRVVMGLPW
jgi:hypothetical protein